MAFAKKKRYSKWVPEHAISCLLVCCTVPYSTTKRTGILETSKLLTFCTTPIHFCTHQTDSQDYFDDAFIVNVKIVD